MLNGYTHKKKQHRLMGLVVVVLLSLLAVGLVGAQDNATPQPVSPEGNQLQSAAPEKAELSPLAQLYTDEDGNYARATDLDFLTQVAERDGSVSVVVQMNTQLRGLVPYNMLGDTGKRQVRDTVSERILALPEVAEGVRDVRTYENLPFMAMTVDADGLRALASSTNVAAIQQNRWRVPELMDSTTVIGANGTGGAWERGYTGVGQTIAILDSGFDLDHPFLTGKFVEEGCYGTNESLDLNGIPFIVSSNCAGQATEITGPGTAVYCDVPGGECVHGTHVAGVAAGKGETFNGVAPDANLIGIQVFSRVDSLLCQTTDYPYTSCILAADADILKGMDQVYSLRNDYDIAAVNLSFGSGDYTTEAFCDADNPLYFNAAQELASAGIATVASSGNRAYLNAMGAPACVSNIISVAASGNEITENTVYLYSNTATFLDFLAPGYAINSSIPDDTYGFSTGTSVAAPHIAGAYALMRDYRENLTLDLIYEALKTTATDILRAESGAYYDRPDIGDAIAWLVIPETPELVTPDDGVEFNEPGITFTWTSGADTDFYRLRIFDETGTRLTNEKVFHADCTDTCTATITQPLTDRDVHTWHVVAMNELREATSEDRSFYVDYPGAPTLVSPLDGANFNRPVDFTEVVWEPVETATAYKLKIRDIKAGKNIANTPLTPEICDVSTCTYAIPSDVQSQLRDGGEYKWFVVASNDLGLSKSAKWRFTTVFPAPPVLVSPEDGFVVEGPSQIGAFVWEPVLDVAEYKIIVKDKTAGVKIVKAVVSAGDVCNETTCTYDMTPTDLSKLSARHDYVWKVQSRNELGKTFSDKWTFATDMPGQPDIISPLDLTEFNDPTEFDLIEWTSVIDVTTYRIKLKRRDNKNVVMVRDVTVGVDATCSAGVCSYAPTAGEQSVLKDGVTFKLSVQSRTAYGNNKSSNQRLIMAFPGGTTLVSPADQTIFSQLSQFDQLIWNVNTYATSYQIVIKDQTKKKTYAKINTTSADAEMTCNDTTCIYNTSPELRNGLKDGHKYKWLVKSINEYGKHKSNKFIFNVALAPIDAPVLISPADGVEINDPSEVALLVWSDVTAVSYDVIIVDRTMGNRILKTTVTPGSVDLVCESGTCSYSVDATTLSKLKDGRNYDWRVKASNGSGSNASVDYRFKARFPGATTILTPVADTVINAPSALTSMTWEANVYADEYVLIVKNKANGSKVFQQSLVPNSGGLTCDVNLCTYTVPSALQNVLKDGRDYKWFVKTKNAYGAYKSNKLIFKARF